MRKTGGVKATNSTGRFTRSLEDANFDVSSSTPLLLLQLDLDVGKNGLTDARSADYLRRWKQNCFLLSASSSHSSHSPELSPLQLIQARRRSLVDWFRAIIAWKSGSFSSLFLPPLPIVQSLTLSP